MLTKRSHPLGRGLSLALCLALLTLLPAAAAPWSGRNELASAQFVRQWQRTDHELVGTDRTWYWGPAPWFDYYEFYRESPKGLRLVQYFDKARMEINDPDEADVTNGLLVVEMVGGQLKLGDDPADNASNAPADIPVAGDPLDLNPEAPTYASFAPVATINDPALNRDAERIGQPVGATLERGGNKGYSEALVQAYAERTRIVQYNEATGHNIPKVFWDFLKQRGPVYTDGGVQNDIVVDWLAAMGLPITDPYWVKTRLGGVERDVLVQLYERRVLTYTPSNPPGYQVEMGNVGQHYFQWRYPHLAQPWAIPGVDFDKIAYASQLDGTRWEIYTINDDGSITALTELNASSFAYSWRHTYPTDDRNGAVELLIDSTYSNSSVRQLYALNLDGEGKRLLYSDGTPPPTGYPPVEPGSRPAHDFNAAASPDSTKIAFVSDRSGQHQLYLMQYPSATGTALVQLTFDSCMHLTPSWSPDGRSLTWMADCDGDFDIYKGELAYAEDRSTGAALKLQASLVNLVKLTHNANDDGFPRYAPDGTKLAYQSDRDGNVEVYLMDADGRDQVRLTRNDATDEAPSWSPDGTELVFSSNRDGNWELYKIRVDGSQEMRLTKNSRNDRFPIWWQ